MHPNHCPGSWCPPEMGPWVSNDECGAMSNAMFEEFLLPELVDLSETFGGLGMHCCAAAEHQFSRFLKIPNFYAFNRVAAQKGYDPILESLGGPAGPVHVLGWLGEDLIERLISRAPEGTRFIFEFGGPTEDCKRWLEKGRKFSPHTD